MCANRKILSKREVVFLLLQSLQHLERRKIAVARADSGAPQPLFSPNVTSEHTSDFTFLGLGFPISKMDIMLAPVVWSYEEDRRG